MITAKIITTTETIERPWSTTMPKAITCMSQHPRLMQGKWNALDVIEVQFFDDKGTMRGFVKF